MTITGRELTMMINPWKYAKITTPMNSKEIIWINELAKANHEMGATWVDLG